MQFEQRNLYNLTQMSSADAYLYALTRTTERIRLAASRMKKPTVESCTIFQGEFRPHLSLWYWKLHVESARQRAVPTGV